jgi:hypothetical protein
MHSIRQKAQLQFFEKQKNKSSSVHDNAGSLALASGNNSKTMNWNNPITTPTQLEVGNYTKFRIFLH